MGLNNLPQGWVECEFEECINKINIKNKLKQKDYLQAGIFPVIDQGQEYISGYFDDENYLVKIETPVVVFGDHTRCFKYIDFSFIAGADGIKILEPIKYFNNRLFYYFCLALKFPNKGYSRHYQYLAKTIIKLPPLNEQKRIVEKIERAFENIDKGIESLTKAKEQIKQYRQSVLKSAFEGKLYKATEWEEKTFAQIMEINPKTNIPLINDEDMVSFLPMPAVQAEMNSYSEDFVSYLKVKRRYTKFQNNDVLFAKITPCMENGKACVVNNLKYGVGFGSTEFHILRSLGKILPNFIFYFIIQNSFRKTAQTAMTGAVGQRRIPAEYLKQIKIKLPSIDEQQQIVEEIENRFSVAGEVEKIVDESLEKAKQLKQSILKKAFEGRLVAQDPNDEPASILLEKIKKEKANDRK